MQLPEGISIFFIGGMVMTVAGFILDLVGIFTIEWSTSSYTDVLGNQTDLLIGLFRFCYGDLCEDVDDSTIKLPIDTIHKFPSDVKFVRGVALTGAILALVAIILATLYLVFGLRGTNRIKLAPLASGILAILAFLSVLVGVIIYGTIVHDEVAEAHTTFGDSLDFSLGYSFVLTVVGGILFLIGGILFLCTNNIAI